MAASVDFENAGFEVIPEFISPSEVRALLEGLRACRLEALCGGIRHIDHLLPAVAALARAPRVLSAAARRLSGPPRLVRTIYFEKSPANNWLVTWHQDRTIAVSERFEAEGWGPWSRKDEVWHVQPPLKVLEAMITVRVHLDAAHKENGCLKLVPGSHNAGLLPTAKVHEYVEEKAVTYAEVPAGGALLMRPHLLHASEKALSPRPRRVLHFEYSSYVLPDGITWIAE